MVNAEGNPVRTRRIFAVLDKVYGSLFLIATIGTVISLVCVSDLLTNATHVNGQVVYITYGAKGARAPVVRFKTANGEMLQLQSDLYTSPAPKMGDTVKVVYRTANPRDWRIDDWIHLYFWTLMGLIFMFAWAMAIIITKLIGHFQIRKLERAGDSPAQLQGDQTSPSR
jgi:hypothetical protein